MSKVCYQEALVKISIALQTNTLSSSAAQVICIVCVDTDVCLVVYNAGKSHRCSLILADVLGKPFCEATVRFLYYEQTSAQVVFVLVTSNWQQVLTLINSKLSKKLGPL